MNEADELAKCKCGRLPRLYDVKYHNGRLVWVALCDCGKQIGTDNKEETEKRWNQLNSIA